MLHVPAPFGVVSAGAGSGGSSGSHLAGLAWAPNGSPLALLTATQQVCLCTADPTSHCQSSTIALLHSSFLKVG